MPGKSRTVLNPESATFGHAGEVEQHRESGDAFDQRADRGAAKSDDEVAFPVSRNSSVLGLGGPLADHDVGAYKLFAATTAASPRHAQRPPDAQAGRQLAAQPAADQANASQAAPPGLTASVSVSASPSRDPSSMRLLFAYRRARRVRSRLPAPPPSPADARTPGSLGGGPEFFLWMPGDFDGRGRTLRAAWKLEATEGMRKLEQYASWLQRDWPAAAASGREGLKEIFTVNRLGLPASLRRCLTTTNIIDSTHAGIRQRTRRVTNWKNGEMALRWAAVAFVETEKHYRRLCCNFGQRRLVA